MQAIETTFYYTYGGSARIKANCERGKIILHPNELSGEAVHIWAAKKLCEKFAEEDRIKWGFDKEIEPSVYSTWAKPFITGGLKRSYVHVFCS